MAEEKQIKKRKSEYSSAMQSLNDIWHVLEKYSSKEHPMSAGEIQKKLEEIYKEDAPSASTVKRAMANQLEALATLHPQSTIQVQGRNGIINYYVSNNSLHIVLEDPEGKIAWNGQASVVFDIHAASVPSLSGLDNMMQNLYDGCSQLPIRLKCVYTQTKNGIKTVGNYNNYYDEIDYADISKNNKARRYYLESVLTPSQWRILTDLIKVYPYIGQNETLAILSALDKIFPGANNLSSNRYAFKRESHDLFKNLAKIDKAIIEKHPITLRYGEYVLKKNKKIGAWEPVLRQKDFDSGLVKIEPYALMWANGYYYLIGKNNKRTDMMMNLRADRILSVGIDEQNSFEIPKDFDPNAYRDKSPVMHPGELEFIKMKVGLKNINTILDVFGRQAKFSEPKDGYTTVSLLSSRAGAKLFATEYWFAAEILEPEDFRVEIRDALKAAYEKYCDQ